MAEIARAVYWIVSDRDNRGIVILACKSGSRNTDSASGAAVTIMAPGTICFGGTILAPAGGRSCAGGIAFTTGAGVGGVGGAGGGGIGVGDAGTGVGVGVGAGVATGVGAGVAVMGAGSGV